METQKKNKVTWTILSVAVVGIIATTFALQQTLKNSSTNRIFINDSLIKSSDKIKNEFTKIDKENTNKENEINEIITNWEKNKTEEENKVLELNKIIDLKTSEKTEIENLVKWYSPFKINVEDLKRHLFTKYFETISEIDKLKRGESNSFVLDQAHLAKLDFLKSEVGSYLEGFKGNLNQIIDKTRNSILLRITSSDFLIDTSYEVHNYLETYTEKLTSFNTISTNNYHDFVKFIKAFFETFEEQVLKINAALNIFLQNLNAKFNILKEEIQSFKTIKEMDFHSIEILKKYLAQNSNLIALLKHDSDFIDEKMKATNLSNQDKELIYKTYLFAYSKKFSIFVEGIHTLLNSVLEIEGISLEKSKLVTKTIKDISALKLQNKIYFDIANKPFEKILNITDISSLFKVIADVNYKVLSNVFELINMFIIEIEQDKTLKDNIFRTLNEVSNKLGSWTLRKEKLKIQKQMLVNKIKENSALLNTESLSNSDKENIRSKIKVFEKEKQKLELAYNEMQLNFKFIQNEYDEASKQGMNILKKWNDNLVILKYLNYSLSSIFGESNNNIQLIKDLKNQILSITNENKEVIKSYDEARNEHNRKIEILNNEIDNLKLKNELQIEKNNEYNAKITKLNSKMSELSLIKRNLSANVFLLTKELEKKKLELENSEANLTERNALIAKLENKIEEEKNKLSLVEGELTKINNEKNDLLVELTKLEKTNSDLILKIDHLTSDKENLINKLTELESSNNKKISNLNTTISRISAENRSLEENINKINAELERSNLELDNKTKSIENLKAELIELENKTNLEIETKTREKEELQKALTKSEEALKKLKEEHLSYSLENNKERDDLKLLLDARKREIVDITSRLNEKDKEIEYSRTYIQSLSEVNEKLSNEKISLTEKLQIATKALETAKKREKDLENKLVLLRNQLDDQILKYNKLSDQTNYGFINENKKRRDLEKEINNLKKELLKQNEKNKKELDNLIREKNELISEIESLKIKELAYAKLVMKANTIIKKAIGILQTYRSWTEDNRIRVNVPEMPYDIELESNGYVRRRVPRPGQYASMLRKLLDEIMEKNVVFYKNNGEEVFAEALKVLKEWELPAELENEINNLISSHN
ncbi:hypothetical protein [Mycoplasmopsis glycophila]|uniref:Uncharacterized protein n=1 Tax=Mycoplasmopsis glycophila TaxID=171285 RepID=A0A449AV65_9BACT|nr:hypothetical protein [Mycoplasmopsis glycophila]VEU70386.1 Uncharacterised protein [Mycoplasmopsis glycophila]